MYLHPNLDFQKSKWSDPGWVDCEWEKQWNWIWVYSTTQSESVLVITSSIYWK